MIIVQFLIRLALGVIFCKTLF